VKASFNPQSKTKEKNNTKSEIKANTFMIPNIFVHTFFIIQLPVSRVLENVLSPPAKCTLIQKRRPVNGTLVTKGCMAEEGGGSIRIHESY
jgi:hypothetical protein